MDFEVFWCKIKLRVCLLCFFSFQHTFVETKATKTFSEVKSCVFSLSKFQKCRQKKVISWRKYLKNQRIMRHNRILPPGKSKVTQDLVPHQFSSQTEHYLMSSPRARKSSRNASAYCGPTKRGQIQKISAFGGKPHSWTFQRKQDLKKNNSAFGRICQS